jgi:two-component system, OmpR family, response regulator MprA
MRILVVEDEQKVADALREGLEDERYDVVVERTGEGAFFRVNTETFDVVLLDLTLPGRDGLEILRALRQRRMETPVLVLTARDSLRDRVTGLDAGADDYLVKPFALKELLARLRALMRRTDPVDETTLRFADLTLDTASRRARRGEREFDLTRTEYSLLELFLRHPRQVLARSQIYESVWGYDFGASSNSLGVYIGYLRRKTEADGEPRLLHTARGVGYALREQR